MTNNSNENLFQVNLKGMISLLSEHIYSTPGTFIRELLQNAVDAITALRGLDETFAGCIDVYIEGTQDSPLLRFCDNGIGLKEEEVLQFLTVIGESSKRDTPRSDDYIGRFGIGLLSCFVVTDEIRVLSRSVMKAPAVEWLGKVDGTYQLTRYNEDIPHGSQVILSPKKEWKHLFTYEAVKNALLRYGDALPYPVQLHYQGKSEQINTTSPIWLHPKASREQLIACGRDIFNSTAIDAFPVKTQTGDVEGVLYVLPYNVQFSSSCTHKIYLKRMYLSDEHCKLLPSWAFFIRALLNVGSLRSTASRESLVQTVDLKAASDEIGNQIKAYLRNLLVLNPDRFEALLNVHEFHIKAVASEDNELLQLFMPHLTFETNKGYRCFADIVTSHRKIFFTRNMETFKQVRRIAAEQDRLVINASYTFDETLLRKYARMDTELDVEEMTTGMLLGTFSDTQEEPLFSHFEEKAGRILKSLGCIAKLKQFTPKDIPAIFFPGERLTGEKKASNPMAELLGNIPSAKKEPASLVFNATNTLVRQLITVDDDDRLFTDIIHILYVQALLHGKHPVSASEMELFNQALQELMLRNFQINFPTDFNHEL